MKVAGPFVRRAALLLAAPGAVWLGATAWAWLAASGLGASPESSLYSGAEVVRARFAGLAEAATRVVSLATSDSARDAYHTAVRGPWGERVEGVGVLAPDGTLESWEGSPTVPPGAGDRRPRWIVSTEGLRVRLMVTGGADPTGRSGTLTVLLDSGLGDLDAAD